MHSGWLSTASGIVLSLLLVRALWARFRGHSHDDCDKCETSNSDNTMKVYEIKGMMCNHCRANVEKSIAAVSGVENVDVDLAAGEARVEGNAAPEAVIAAVEAAGYDCKEKA